MPRPRALPETSVLLRHKEFEGLTLTDIARMYGVNKSAVSHALNRANRPWGKEAPVDYQSVIPWDIKRPHLALDACVRLYAHIRDRSGVELRSAAQRRLDNWRARLVREHVTLDYTPVAEGTPWVYVPRLESDRRMVIRWPSDHDEPTDTQRQLLSLP